MEIFYIVVVLLILSRLGGEVAERLGQPALAGELIAGVLLGLLVNVPSETVPVFAHVAEYEGFQVLADFGMFFLMLLAGVELRPAELREASGAALSIAFGSLVLPLVGGFVATWCFVPASDERVLQSLFVGVALAITAVPVTVRVFSDLGKLHSRVGNVAVAAALVSDLVNLVLLAVLASLVGAGSDPMLRTLLWTLAKAAVYVAVTAVIARVLLPWLYRHVVRHARVQELELSVLLIVALAFAALGDLWGLHFILGPFVAGLFFGRRSIAPATFDEVRNKLSGITSGFLAPLFFVSIGLHTDLAALLTTPGFFLLLLGVAFAAKLVGASVPARMSGFTLRESVAVGVGMNCRGAVELVVADIALRAGVFTAPAPTPPVLENMYGSIVLVAVVTTMTTPLLLRSLLKGRAGGSG